jgi:hypothetical protein
VSAQASRHAAASPVSCWSASCMPFKAPPRHLSSLVPRRTSAMKLQAPVRPAKPGLPSAWSFIRFSLHRSPPLCPLRPLPSSHESRHNPRLLHHCQHGF